MSESQRLVSVIAQLETQRAALGDAVVDAATQPLRAQLAALHAAATEQTLRQVSVLFTDVVGSTTLSERLDPEDIHGVMDGALERFSAIVRAQGGRVLQYAGDSMLGVFGADRVLEDDAERAVRAGLAILDEALAQGAAIERRYRHRGFAVRVGISTGRVLLGGGVDGEGTIRGISVNVAARMEQSAPAGGLRISHDTYRHVRGVFDVIEQPAASVKGIAQPVRSYLVLRAKPRAFRLARRGIEGIATALIGREPELGRLTTAFDTVLAERRLVALNIVGDAGLGKSRLLDEFDHWLELRPETIWLFHGRARPQGHGGPFGVLRDLLAWRFEIQESDSQAVAQTKLASGLGAVFGERADEQSALIGQLIGLDCSASPHIAGIATDARQIRDRGFHALAEYFRLLHASDGSPIALLLDDLHWADDGSLDWIAHLLLHCTDVPMLVLGLARPLLYERHPKWDQDTALERLALAPLSAVKTQALTEALLARVDGVPRALRDQLADSADGNPFFIEELVAMLIDDGVIETGDERWHLRAERLAGLSVPATLTGVLQARLDSLPGPEKSALQEASVIGAVFWDDALRRIEASAPLALDALAERELARHHETSAFEGAREFGFKHHLLHQVTYESVLRRHKREQHRLTAEWLIERSGDRISEYHDLIAMHYERADDVPNALHYLRKAADDAMRTCANGVVLDCVARALAIAAEDDAPNRFALLLLRSEVLRDLGRSDDYAADVAHLEHLADLLADPEKRARANGARSRQAFSVANYPAAIAAAERAIELAEQAGVPEASMAARASAALSLLYLGEPERARAHAEVQLRIACAAGNGKVESSAWTSIGHVEAHRGRFREATVAFRESLRAARSCGDRRGEAIALTNHGLIELALGGPEAAALLHESVQVARETGYKWIEGGAMNNLASLAHTQGREAEALEWLDQALELVAQTQNRALEASVRVTLAEVHAASGKHALARAAFERALDLYVQTGRSTLLAVPRAGLARLALARGQLTDAMVQVESIVAQLEGGGSLSGVRNPAWIEMACHQVMAAAGDPRAPTWLERAHSSIVEQHERHSPDDRAALLANAPDDREILAAWEAARQALP
ncbi:MAG: adenylate/guanylate cyclase domain-containing protein [Caldimonas sp.]